jgi:hypothetical protein
MKIFINIVKKIILSFLLIYGYNLIMYPLNLYIPINNINILVVYMFGIKGFIYLFLILIFIF